MAARVLVVEDDALLAINLAEILDEAGFTVVGPATTVEEGRLLATGTGCDVAVLDVQMGKETSASIAGLLRSRSVPFVVLSAYAPDQYPPEFEGAPRLSKPLREPALIAALRDYLP